MLVSSFTVLLPVLFVMGLGYWAGRTKRFDADQIQGLNELVMTYALPALMFVATVAHHTRSELLQEVPFLLALLIAFLGLYNCGRGFRYLVAHLPIGGASLKAFLITFPSVAFFGIPIFKGLFGPTSLVSIATADVSGSVTILPLTIVLLEIHAQRSESGEVKQLGQLTTKALVNSFSKPMVWAPLVGAVFVLFDIDFPKVIDDMFALHWLDDRRRIAFSGGLDYCVIQHHDQSRGHWQYHRQNGAPARADGVRRFSFWNSRPVGTRRDFDVRHSCLGGSADSCCPLQGVQTEAASTVVADSLLMLVTFTVIIYLTGG